MNRSAWISGNTRAFTVRCEYCQTRDCDTSGLAHLLAYSNRDLENISRYARYEPRVIDESQTRAMNEVFGDGYMGNTEPRGENDERNTI